MPVFFLVGGYANALSWCSARARGVPYAGWLRSRLRRLLVPVVPLLLTWLVACSIAVAAGRRAARCARHPRWRWCPPGSSRPTSSSVPWRP